MELVGAPIGVARSQEEIASNLIGGRHAGEEVEDKRGNEKGRSVRCRVGEICRGEKTMGCGPVEMRERVRKLYLIWEGHPSCELL